VGCWGYARCRGETGATYDGEADEGTIGGGKPELEELGLAPMPAAGSDGCLGEDGDTDGMISGDSVCWMGESTIKFRG
jgi:hypothetical protein